MHGSPTDPDALIAHIVAGTGVPAGVARRIVEDVLAFHRESVDGYVRRRHRELSAQGCRNEVIYRTVVAEVSARLFTGPELSARQIRRIIYG
jgi:hypothetical protein